MLFHRPRKTRIFAKARRVLHRQTRGRSLFHRNGKKPKISQKFKFSGKRRFLRPECKYSTFCAEAFHRKSTTKKTAPSLIKSTHRGTNSHFPQSLLFIILSYIFYYIYFYSFRSCSHGENKCCLRQMMLTQSATRTPLKQKNFDRGQLKPTGENYDLS